MISSAKLAKKEFSGVTLPEPYGSLLGKIPMNASAAIWGPKGSGKSTLAVDLAFVLTNTIGKGIYCSSEEGAGPSMQGKITRLGAEHEDLMITDFEGLEDLKAAIKYSQAKFVVFDSPSMSYVKLSDFEAFHEWCKKQNVMLFYILHATKDGNYKGNTMFVHLPDIEIKVQDGIAETEKNRFQETPREMEVVFEREKRSNPDKEDSKDNIRHGIEAMKKVIETHEDVENAMSHPELGSIDFIWGQKGKKGYGIAHIIERRDAQGKSDPRFEGQKGKDLVLRIPVVIDKGNIDEVNERRGRMVLAYAGYRVILKREDESQHWILTGYRKTNRKNPDETADLLRFEQSYAQQAYMESRPEVGAGLNGLKDTKNVKKFRLNDTDLAGLECIEDDDFLRENKGVSPDEIYQMITDRMISTIKKVGHLPWQQEWKETGLYEGRVATNFVSKKPYRGINYFMLNFETRFDEDGEPFLAPRDLTNPYFLTFKQVERLKGKVKKGSRGNEVVYFVQLYQYEQQDPKLDFGTYSLDKFKAFLTENADSILGNSRTFYDSEGTPRARKNPTTLEELLEQAESWYIPLLKYYNVFHAEDITGIDWGIFPENENADLPEDEKIEVAEAIYEHYPTAPEIKHDTPKAFYMPTGDFINMPNKTDFSEIQHYYTTLFHEAVHSTGHKSRLDRDLSGHKGSESYAFEELIAEMGAVFLCAESGILFKTIDNSAKYLQGWNSRLVKHMEDDNKFFFRAASRSQAAADYILDRNEAGIPAYRKDLELKEGSNAVNHLKGSKTTIDFKADGSIQESGHYALMEVKDVIPSHNKDCSANSKHKISKGQPRDRSLDALCNQPKFIAQNLNPSSITQGTLAFNGAPVVLSDGQVIQGNGRGIAMKIAYDEYAKKAKKYKAYLKSHAKDFGLTKKEVSSYNQPVLVRVVDVSNKRAIELGNVVDTSQAKMSKVDQAKAYIRNLSKAKKQAIGNLINNSRGETLGEVLDDVGLRIMDQFKELDRAELVDENNLTSEGKDFLRSVFAGLVFDSDENKNALKYFLDLKHTQKAGLERSYGNIIPFIETKADITPTIQKAVEIVVKVQKTDGLNTVSDFLNQSDVFEGANKDRFTQKEAQLAEFLLNASTQKEIRNAFRMYQWKITGKEDFFNPIEKVSPAKAFEDAFVKQERINPSDPLIYIGTTEKITIDAGGELKGMKGNFPTFLSDDKIYIVPEYRVEKAKNLVPAGVAEEEFEEWHNYEADDTDFAIDWPEKEKSKSVGSAVKIWYASDKVIQPGDAKGKTNYYVHEFDAGKRPAVVKGDILIIGNIDWNERGILN